MSRRRGRYPRYGHGLLILLVFASACSAPAAEPVPPMPATVEAARTEAPSPSPTPAEEPPSTPPPSSRIEHPRAERCEGLLAVVEEVHEDPHDVKLPEPYTLIYESELDPQFGDDEELHPLGTQHRWTIRVWPRLHESDRALSFTVLHEVGHLYDIACLGNEGRLAWMNARGTGDSLVQWGSGSDRVRPNEDYASAWAVCQGGDPAHWTVAGESPTPGECSLVVVPVE